MPADPIDDIDMVRPQQAADDFIESSLLAEENRRLKAELHRVEDALHTASRLMRSIDGVLAPYGQRKPDRR